MFVEERHSLILEKLNQTGKVRVKDLAEEFNVTEDLIRKDLQTLEKSGKLKRKYGGAVLIKQNVQHQIVSSRKADNFEIKKAIANKAFKQIERGMVIFLDISTVNIHLAQLIADANMPITVVTNMLEVVSILAHSNVNFICIGGEMDYGRDGFIGPLAFESLKNFRFDACFMGAVGVDLETNSVEIYMANEGLTKKQVVSASKKAYLLVDESKFSINGNYRYASLDDFDYLVCDRPISRAYVKDLKDLHQVEVL